MDRALRIGAWIEQCRREGKALVAPDGKRYGSEAVAIVAAALRVADEADGADGADS